MGFDHPQEHVVVDGRVSQQVLGAKLLVEFLDRPKGIGLRLDLDGFEHLRGQAPGPAPVGARLGFQALEALPAVLLQPALHGRDLKPPSPVTGEVVFPLCLRAEVVVLHPAGLGQHGADDRVAHQGNLFTNVFLHGLSSLRCGGFGLGSVPNRGRWPLT